MTETVSGVGVHALGGGGDKSRKARKKGDAWFFFFIILVCLSFIGNVHGHRTKLRKCRKA